MLSKWQTEGMTETSGVRAQARAVQIKSIKEVARRLIKQKTVSGLSLREVAREMGLVSSALYRYFATRDELLTALILDAYNDLGAHVERAEAKVSRADYFGRFRAAARAVRRWARRNPHEYALLYGTPSPDYVAPVETIVAAARVALVLGSILRDVYQSVKPVTSNAEDPSSYLEVEALAAVLPGVPSSEYLRAVMAWTMIFGFQNCELFGQYEGTVKNADLAYDQVITEIARSLSIEVS